MDSESLNLIPAKVCGSYEHIWLELPDSTRLQLPRHYQLRLAGYLNRKIQFGINSEFIELGKNEEQLNVCLGKLMSVDEGKEKMIVQFTIADHPVKARLNTPSISQADVGQMMKFNFDTFFGHVFDPDTQLNLTI